MLAWRCLRLCFPGVVNLFKSMGSMDIIFFGFPRGLFKDLLVFWKITLMFRTPPFLVESLRNCDGLMVPTFGQSLSPTQLCWYHGQILGGGSCSRSMNSWAVLLPSFLFFFYFFNFCHSRKNAKSNTRIINPSFFLFEISLTHTQSQLQVSPQNSLQLELPILSKHRPQSNYEKNSIFAQIRSAETVLHSSWTCPMAVPNWFRFFLQNWNHNSSLVKILIQSTHPGLKTTTKAAPNFYTLKKLLICSFLNNPHHPLYSPSIHPEIPKSFTTKL